MTNDSGLAVIRSALIARRHKGHLSNMARELGLSTPALESFAFGQANLAADLLDRMAKDMLGPNVSYDSTTDKLRRAKNEPIAMTLRSPQCVRQEMEYRAGEGQRGPQPVIPVKPQTLAKRAGWVA